MIDGGFLDVDIKISGPDNHVMHESEKESSGKYTFVAPAKEPTPCASTTNAAA